LQASEVIELAGDHARFLALAERVGDLHPADPAARLVVAQFTGLAAAYRGEHRRAAVPLRRALELAGPTGIPAALTGATVAAMTLGDGESSLAVAAQAVALARAAAAPQLPESLGLLAFVEFQAGRYAAAAAHAEEGLRRARELGQHNTAAANLSVLALLAAVTGDGAAAVGRARAAAGPASSRGVIRPLALTTWARVRHGLAAGGTGGAAAGGPVGPATARGMHPTIRVLATPDLVEALVRQGDRARAGRLLAVFDRWASGTGSRPLRALSARCRGLLADSDGAAADAYAEALALHGTGAPDLERARTQLLHGQAVRHGRRPAAAREHLHEALAVFERLDAGPWAERARAELRAAGAATGGSPPPAGGLTPQQWQVARLVAAGATNREVAAELVLSTRTVEHHLRQVFVRLGVRSRTELALRVAGADR
ncbi:MAG TPA: LuxR C-terminal-related transcriptional regulator, partial [Mycobacteriales bacterium]|nr:LuxR C-terminal-related transcriptional regulator [Mycobacteriales bacterium]